MKNINHTVRLLGLAAALVAASLCGSMQAGASQWYLNGKGASNNYQIWAFGDDGFPLSLDPVILPPSGVTHLAWPSAVREGSIVRTYVSAYSGGWNTIRLYTSPDGLSFTDQGVIFSADASEPYGVGPAYVMRDAGGPDPYVLFYLVRGAGGPGNRIAVATSSDGISWTRRGSVISASLPQEADGLSMSYACKTQAGQYVLAYHGYYAGLTKGAALLATAAAPTSSFSGKIIAKLPDEFASVLTATAGQNTATVPAGVAVPLGIPLLISDASREHVIAKRQDGVRIWLDRPLLSSHSSAALLSVAKAKVDISYVQEKPDGSWAGIATLYGPAALVAEYTTGVKAQSLNGPWTYDGLGFRFQPWLPSFLYSLENPTPLVSSSSCSN